MQLKKIALLRLKTPFKHSFGHALSERTYSDKILVILSDEQGRQGYGEVLARAYVSGETNDDVFANTGPALAKSLLGQHFESLAALQSYLTDTLRSEQWGTAVFGGYELALLNLFGLSHGISQHETTALLGPERYSATGSCMTIGFECKDEHIRRYAIQARLSGATAVKMKIGLDNDASRLQQLNTAFKGKMPIRLDANGSMSLTQMSDLLLACKDLPIHSVEQPFAANDPELEQKLVALYASTKIPLMADESLCTLSDARRWIDNKAYQVFNIRIGKCGGLLGAIQIRDMAQAAGVDIVAGTMVGESGVLNHASALFLQHTEQLNYVEGLGQNSSFLQHDPVTLQSNKLNPLAAQFAMTEAAMAEQLLEQQVFEA